MSPYARKTPMSTRVNRQTRILRRRVRTLATAVLATLSMGLAHANLVVNGGFETTDLSGWSTSNNFIFSGVECGGPPDAFQGNCNLFSGPIGLPGTLSQSFATV